MVKKYQIFISATYEDLKEERKKVQDTILSMHQFPAGMEMFSASNEESWEIIRETMDNSDFYVLIIGHKYGSVIEDGIDAGISYTQREYYYALEKKIPVFAFLIDNSVRVTVDQMEQEIAKREKLEAFKKEVKNAHHVEWWLNKDDLATKVSVALYKKLNNEKESQTIKVSLSEELKDFGTAVKNEYGWDKETNLLPDGKVGKVFVSYSWTPESNKRWVEKLVHRLEADGVQVIVDFNDLRPGYDKYAFMERTVYDDSIKTVLIICNKTYKEKADGRVGGVGEESAIITPQVYGRMQQEKFIPVVNEYDENGRPFLPNYLASKMYVDLKDFEGGYEKLLNCIKEVNEKESVVNKSSDSECEFVISDICIELRAVLQEFKPNSQITCYCFDYELLKENGVTKVITDGLVNVDYNVKENICRYLWKKTFIDAQKDIDFCYVYLLIDLFNNQNVRIKFSREMQKLNMPEIKGFYPGKIRYWHTSVEALFYLLERCPQVYYEMLDEPLKEKLRISAGRNLKYIVREFYLWDSTKKHIEHIRKKIDRLESYEKNLKVNSPKCAIWNCEDLLFLYNSQKTESEKNEVVDFIMTLFRNCHYYDRASGLFEAVFYLLKETVIKEEEILDIINKNSQIYDTIEYRDYLETVMNCASARLNLKDYPNINKVFQDNYNAMNL